MLGPGVIDRLAAIYLGCEPKLREGVNGFFHLLNDIAICAAELSAFVMCKG